MGIFKKLKNVVGITAIADAARALNGSTQRGRTARGATAARQELQAGYDASYDILSPYLDQNANSFNLLRDGIASGGEFAQSYQSSFNPDSFAFTALPLPSQSTPFATPRPAGFSRGRLNKLSAQVSQGRSAVPPVNPVPTSFQPVDILPQVGGLPQVGSLPQVGGLPQAGSPLVEAHLPDAGFQVNRGGVNPNQFQIGTSAPLPAAGFNAPVDPFSAAQFDFRADPGYQFRLQQGGAAIDRGAAARGKSLSGQAAKALAQFGQNLGAEAYAKARDRAVQENQLAYDRALGQNNLNFDRGLALSNQSYQRGLTQNQLGYDRALAADDRRYQRDLTQNNASFDRGIQLNNARQANLGANFDRSLRLRDQSFNQALSQNQLGYDRGLTANRLNYNRTQSANQRGYDRSVFADQRGYDRALTTNRLGYDRALGQNQLAYDRALTQDQRNADRFYQNDALRYGRLAGLVGTQLGIANAVASNRNALGGNLANNLTGAAAALNQSTNLAVSNGIGIGNSLLGAFVPKPG